MHGALVLAASAFLVKLIGAFFKVPLANILGGTGMGYFMTAYDMFGPVRSLAVAGIPVAVSKLVSESMAQKRYADAARIFRLALLLMCCTGVLGAAVLYLFGADFASIAGNPSADLAVTAMAPAVFFCCLVSVYRGYYEGQRNMYPTAVSQVLEAVVRLVCGIGFAGAALRAGTRQFAETGFVFGYYAANEQQAAELLTSVTSAAAVLGVAVSSFAALLFFMLRHLVAGPDSRISDSAGETKILRPRGYGSILWEILLTAVPVCLGSLVVSMGSLIDLFTVMNRLQFAITAQPAWFAQQYAQVLGGGVELAQLPNYLYGCYTGLALTIFGIVPAVTAVFGVSALPAVASAWAVRSYSRTHANISAVLRIVSILSCPAGLGICVMSRPILELFFAGRQDEISVAAPLLSILGIAVIFVSLTASVNSMLQGVGRMDLPVKIMFFGAVLKLLVNYFLIGLPQFGILAAPLGSLCCYAFIVCMSVYALCGETGLKLSLWEVFGRPLLAGAACAAGALSLIHI